MTKPQRVWRVRVAHMLMVGPFPSRVAGPAMLAVVTMTPMRRRSALIAWLDTMLRLGTTGRASAVHQVVSRQLVGALVKHHARAVKLGSTATWDPRCANSVVLVLQTTTPMHQRHAQIVLQAHMLDVVKPHAMNVRRVKSTVMRIQRRHALPACLDSTG